MGTGTTGSVPDVTRHGARRARERTGVPKSAVGRMAANALEKGLPHEDTSGGLRRYLDWLYVKGDGGANNMRVYGDHIYLFNGKILITVFNVPPEYRKAAKHQQEKRRSEK